MKVMQNRREFGSRPKAFFSLRGKGNREDYVLMPFFFFTRTRRAAEKEGMQRGERKNEAKIRWVERRGRDDY